MRREMWVSDASNKKVRQIRQSFEANLSELAKDSRINYYDFLLVAKKMSFRFQESSHLMALKNFFSKNKNSILVRKLVDVMAVNHESLISKDDKIIVKFNVPENDFAPIKQATNEDEEQYYEDELGSELNQAERDQEIEEDSDEINEKLSIILSLKVEEVHKKIKSITNPYHSPNIFLVFGSRPDLQISYEHFKSGILDVILATKERLRFSEEDIKALFHILGEGKASLTFQDIEKLRDPEDINEPMRQFYSRRINRNMVKNTLFKLGKVRNSSIQIYQLKNASVLEFKQMEESMINEPVPRQITAKKRIPHFGPLKSAAKFKKNEKHYNSESIKHAVPHYKVRAQLDRQREKIEKILRNSKEGSKKSKTGDTVASKLRSLFIHKVILPREKMLQEQKQKYRRGRSGDNHLAIPLKDIH